MLEREDRTPARKTLLKHSNCLHSCRTFFRCQPVRTRNCASLIVGVVRDIIRKVAPHPDGMQSHGAMAYEYG